MRGDSSGGVRRAAVVVGREVEFDQLARALDAVHAGGSRCLFLMGEGGIGKTRLLAEIAEEGRRLGLAVMAGRAPVTSPVAFSVVSEALRSWLRLHEMDIAMGPFTAGLRLVLPEWPVDVAASSGLTDAQLRLLAFEGVVRLVQHVAAGGGVVILLDDLHSADPDSIEAIRYLAAAGAARVLIIGALRAGESTVSEQIVRGLTRDLSAEVLDLEPLGRREVAELLGALLDAEAPHELIDDVMARTDGVPLLVEEVLDAHVRSGSLHVSGGHAQWRGGTPLVSRNVRGMVDARVERLTSGQRKVIAAGAVLGAFDIGLLVAVTQQPTVAVGDAVAAALNAGLLETVGGAVDFRHALIREAVLESTLPHVQRMLHRRAADALEHLPGVDATILERRAHHVEQLDENDEAAQLLSSAASLRLTEHALLSAETLARRGMALASAPAVRAEVSDTLARVLAGQGRWADALALDTAADRAFGEHPARRYRMATCAMDAGQPELAGRLIERAIDEGDASPLVHVIAGRLAIAAGNGDAALASAQRALAEADAINDVEGHCAALDVLARALDYAGRRAEARTAWEQQADDAMAAGLTQARLRAVVQLGKLEVFDGTPAQRLYEAVELARAAGALVEQAWAEENLAIALAIQGDPDAALEVLDDAIPRCRALRLDQLPYLLAARGGVAGMRDTDRAAAFLDEAEQLAPTADMAIHTFGIRADLAARDGRYAEALGWCERAVELLRAQPGGMPSDSPCWLVWMRAAVGDLEGAAVALREARALPDDLARWHGRPVVLAVADALLNGDELGIDAALSSATGRMPLDLALMRVLAAEVLRGPAHARWLREALDIYDAMGVAPATARVRRLLRETGAPVPRRRRVVGTVPDLLAARGVTLRESEVLQLLGDGLSNHTIAERLHLSVRTVETYVSSLLSKLHVESRGQLTALSANHRLASTETARPEMA